jgi:hypothetical protein
VRHGLRTIGLQTQLVLALGAQRLPGERGRGGGEGVAVGERGGDVGVACWNGEGRGERHARTQRQSDSCFEQGRGLLVSNAECLFVSNKAEVSL